MSRMMTMMTMVGDAWCCCCCIILLSLLDWCSLACLSSFLLWVHCYSSAWSLTLCCILPLHCSCVCVCMVHLELFPVLCNIQTRVIECLHGWWYLAHCSGCVILILLCQLVCLCLSAFLLYNIWRRMHRGEVFTGARTLQCGCHVCFFSFTVWITLCLNNCLHV